MRGGHRIAGAVLAAALLPSPVLAGELEESWTASCTHARAGDILGPGSDASCSADAATGSVSLDVSASSTDLLRGYGPPATYAMLDCTKPAVGAACAEASASVTYSRATDPGDLETWTGSIADLAREVSGSTGGQYGYGYGYAYSQIAVSMYAYGYTCDWDYWTGWECLYSDTVTNYGYVECYPSGYCDAGTSVLSLSVWMPGCFLECHPGGENAAYSRIYLGYTVTARATAAGEARAGAIVQGRVDFMHGAPRTDPYFDLSPITRTASAGPGGAATYDIALLRGNGHDLPVTMTASGLPPGGIASFDPSPVLGTSSRLTVSIAPETQPGSHNFVISGSDGNQGSLEYDLTLVVELPDYALAVDPASLTLDLGTERTVTVSVARMGNHDEPVALSVSGLPEGVVATVAPNPIVDGTASLSLSASAASPVGVSTLTLTGTDGALARSATIDLTVASPPLTQRFPYSAPTQHWWLWTIGGCREDPDDDLRRVCQYTRSSDRWVDVTIEDVSGLPVAGRVDSVAGSGVVLRRDDFCGSVTAPVPVGTARVHVRVFDAETPLECHVGSAVPTRGEVVLTLRAL